MSVRMDNVGIVVEDLAAAIEFFRGLGLELEGQGTVDGEWAGRVTGLGEQRVEIAMMRTPDGHGRLELSHFLEPSVVADHRDAPVNALGYLRVMFEVDDINEALTRLYERGAVLVSSEVVRYEEVYRLCYVRGPEGILIGLAEAIRRESDATRPRHDLFTGTEPAADRVDELLQGLDAPTGSSRSTDGISTD